ncbi:MAG: rod shape-determining protein [Candidatus Dormibacteraceae bacterium]
MGLWSGGFGVDLGTANTVVCHPRRGVVLNEPSVMVVKANGNGQHAPRPLLVGRAARELTGRTPVGMMTVRPLHDGVITDLESARAFIVAILSRVARRPWERFRPQAVIGVPAGATALERRALIEAAEEAGVGRASLIPEPVAGALGSGIDPLDSRAHMVVDVGGGTAEVTGFCFGGILTTGSCRVAGDEMTLALYQHLRQQHRIIVGELTAEDLKMQVDGQECKGPLVIEGRDTTTGKPKVVRLQPDEVVDAIKPTSDGIIQTLTNCLEDLPPQAVGDVMHDGLVVFGGGSLLKGFDKLVEDAFGFPVRQADRPLTCVAEGAAICLNRPEVLDAYGGRRKN